MTAFLTPSITLLVVGVLLLALAVRSLRGSAASKHPGRLKFATALGIGLVVSGLAGILDLDISWGRPIFQIAAGLLAYSIVYLADPLAIDRSDNLDPRK